MTKNYEPWIWTELVAFDHTKEDMGVKNYLDILGFTPHAICLFVSSPDFILLYSDEDYNSVLPKDCCVYGVYSLDETRNIQPWKMCEVKLLIENLHKYGVKVLVSAMTWFMGNQIHEEWLDTHKEVLTRPNTGELGHSINPLKRIADGSYFEDFFLKQLTDVMDYYGFDGWHAADGWGPTMHTAFDGDFSDDFVNQFTDKTGISFPKELSGNYDEDNEKCKERADFIWKNYRVEWLEFYSDRWQEFFDKYVKEFHKTDKVIMVNSSMTRDPFEAKYRYALDYKKLADVGVDGFIVETGAAAQDLFTGDRNRHYDYAMTFMTIKAYCPETKLIFLHVVQDHCENFDGITHHPNSIEKEVYTLSNLLYFKKDEAIRCADGFMVCLGDGIKSWQWERLQEMWNNGFSNNTNSVGPMVVWSNKAHERQMADFISTRRYHTQKILHKISEAGAPINKICDVSNIDNVTDTLIVLNSYLYDMEDINKILAKDKVIIIGGKDDRLPKPDYYLEDNVETNPLALYAYGINVTKDYTINKCSEKLSCLPMDIVEPHFFTKELEFNPVTSEFIRICVEVIYDGVEVGKPIWMGETYERSAGHENSQEELFERGRIVKVITLKESDNKYRLLIKNDYDSYREVDIDMGKKVKSAKAITEFPFAPVKFEGSQLQHIFVSNKGCLIIEVETE